MNRALSCAALLASLVGCGGSHAPPAPPTTPEAPPAAAPETPPAIVPAAEITEADRVELARGERFAFALFDRVRTNRGNLVFSPASVRIALAMTYAGARGETARQMATTLAIGDGDASGMHRAYADALREWNSTSSATLRVANRLYAERSAPIEAPFLAITRDAYAAEAQSVDFVNAFEPTRLEINRWVADRTERRIEDLLPQGSLTSLTRLVLANAVYFKGSWQTRFDPARTTPEPFTLADGGRPSVNMMRMRSRFAFAHHPDGLRILEMPYAGDELRMVFLLPDATDGLEALEARLDADALRRFRAATHEVELDVGIPRFRLAPTTVRLGPTLAAMGMPIAFGDQADFTGIAQVPGGLYISEVFHKAFVELNEEGTEAAAATAVVIATRGAYQPEPERPRFVADHPFLFALVDRRTDTVLFLGRVADPR